MPVSTSSYHSIIIFLRLLRELPLVWFLVGCLLARIGLSLISTVSPRDRSVLLRRVAFAAGFFVLLAYLAISLSSLRCFMLHGDEANILSISAASLHGLPMYHSPSSPDFSYALMYGPITFLIYRVALLAGGADHFWIIRGFVVAANLGLCAALYLLLRRFVSALTAIALLAFPLSILLQHPELSLGIRSDIWIVLFATLAILFSYFDAELSAVVLTGVMGGLIVGLKITAAPAILFPLLVLYRRFGLRAPAIAALIAAAGVLAPFALHNISPHNYIAWLLFTGSEGISPTLVWLNLLFALFLISPCFLMEIFMRRFGRAFRQRLPEFFLIVFCLFIAVLTSKAGSAPHYLWHIVPSIVVYLALVARDMKDVPASERAVPIYTIAVACALFACVNTPRAWQYIRLSLMPPGVAIAQQSIERFLNIYRDRSSIQMGYGSVAGDYRTELRYILIYRGQPYTIEGNTGRFETKLLPFPVYVFHRMEGCKDDVWLMPHAQRPFEIWILPDRLRTTFLRNYSVERSDGIYDAWVCNHAQPH